MSENTNLSGSRFYDSLCQLIGMSFVMKFSKQQLVHKSLINLTLTVGSPLKTIICTIEKTYRKGTIEAVLSRKMNPVEEEYLTPCMDAKLNQ